MSTPPREWRFFGDPPAPEAPGPEGSDGGLADEDVGSWPGTGRVSTEAAPIAALRAHPLLFVGAAIAGVVLLALVFVGVALASFADRTGSVVIANRSEGTAAVVAPSGLPAGSVSAGNPVVVDVEGAVVLPGLLRVPAGSRVGDVIVAAGGYSSAVDLDAAAAQLNLAAAIGDGDKVHVPSLAERVAIAQRSPASAATGLIDINHADQAALESLPGIGPVTATKIITARSSQPFASLDDAATRKVLSASVVEQIRPLATVTP
jgi:competence protein ComEA